MERKFKKNDHGFTCMSCGHQVEKLNYTSRDHCPKCLFSLHVDINPGDRNNTCKGLMKPIDIEKNQKKGFVIVYKCNKCGELHKNKAAVDDNLDAIISVMNRSYDVYLEKLIEKHN